MFSSCLLPEGAASWSKNSSLVLTPGILIGRAITPRSTMHNTGSTSPCDLLIAGGQMHLADLPSLLKRWRVADCGGVMARIGAALVF